MSQDIVQEITLFLHSILAGLLITFAYDWILIVRELVRHRTVLISIEDFFFWVACGIGVFYLLYRENNGILRWFAVVGATMGMVLYKIIIKKRFVYIMSTCIHKIMCFVCRLILIVLKPIKYAFFAARRFVRFFAKKIKKIKNFVKKKLTVCIKTLKMVLCKR